MFDKEEKQQLCIWLKDLASRINEEIDEAYIQGDTNTYIERRKRKNAILHMCRKLNED